METTENQKWTQCGDQRITGKPSQSGHIYNIAPASIAQETSGKRA